MLSLFLCEYFTVNGSLIIFGYVFSVFITGGEVQSTVTIVGIWLMGFGDVVPCVWCRGGLWAASRVLFGKTVRIALTSEVTGSI